MARKSDQNLINAGFQAGVGLMGVSLVTTAAIAGLVGVLLLLTWHVWAGLLAIVLIVVVWWYAAQESKKLAEQNTRAKAEESVELARAWIRTTHQREPLDEDEVFDVARTRFPI